MLRKTLFIALVAALAPLVTSAKTQAWGGYHVGYTHYSPYTGLHHYGYTGVSRGYGGGYGGYHYGGYGGGGYHYGGYGGYGGGAYHYGGYHYGGYGGYGGYHAGYYRAW
jgi:hypothetical protein